MTQITITFSILLVSWMVCSFGAGAPIDHIQKRSAINCFPLVPPTQPFHWWDCMNAVLDINAKDPNSNNVPYVFGSDEGANYTNDVYAWTSGSLRLCLCSAEHIGIKKANPNN